MTDQTQTTRIKLALAACEGLSDKELTKRGPGAFAKMIARKRQYAFAARAMTSIIAVLEKNVSALRAQNKALQEFEAPVIDTTAAKAMLAKFTAKKGGQ